MILADLCALVPPWLIKEAIEKISASRMDPSVGVFAVGIIAVTALQGLFRYFWRTRLFGVARRVEHGVRERLFSSLLGLDAIFYQRMKVGDLLSRCTNDLTAIQELVSFAALLIVDSFITIVSCLALMGIMSLKLTLLVLIPLPFLSICFRYFGKKVKTRSLEVQGSLAGLMDQVQETLSGIRVVKSYCIGQARLASYREACNEYLDRQMGLAATRGLFYGFLGFLTSCAVAILLGAGGKEVITGKLTLGQFVGFSVYLAMLSWPMMSIGFMTNLLQRALASVERVSEILSAEPQVKGPARPEDLGNVPPEVSFQEVWFSYPGSSAWALRGVSAIFPKGKWVGITGPVGSGKSTLFHLIVRLYDPQKGSVRINGKDLREVGLQELRASIALVSQEPFLFSDSIASNVHPARPHNMNWDHLAGLTGLSKELSKFPSGWETPIGERGITLSGGQRQKVALARALARDAPLILVDDGLCHLDAQSEATVMRNLRAFLSGKTVIFSTHRLPSLLMADWIVVIEEGTISEQGPPLELLETKGYLWRLARNLEFLELGYGRGV